MESVLGERKLGPDDVKVRVPKVRQTTGYSCGAAALKAVCKYFCAGPDDEDEFIEALGSDPDGGTAPADIVRVARKFGLRAVLQKGMPLAELQHHLDAGRPVICAMQAWGDEEAYDNEESGHYVVAVGYNEGNVFFEDPAMDGKSRGFLPIKEFVSRWHDTDKHGQHYDHLGIVFDKKDENAGTHIRKAKRIE